jgi:DNA-directed RNA polymerase specialized sigma24 family protein
MDDDTGIGGADGRFRTTRRSAVLGLRSDDARERERSYDALVAAYWRPVYKYLRVRWRLSNEDAKDATQGFFAYVTEKETFARYDARRARFRTFVRTCLDGFVANELKAGRRIKRGGGEVPLSLDFDAAEDELPVPVPAAPDVVERYFEQEWCRALIGMSVTELRDWCVAGGRTAWFTAFERYDLADPDERPTYDHIGRDLGVPATTVTNHLASARRELRRIVLEKLAEITTTPEELREEARVVLGIDIA